MAQPTDEQAWSPPADIIEGMLQITPLVRRLCLKLFRGQSIDDKLPELRCMLEWLDGPILMTPRIRGFTHIDTGLRALFEHDSPAVRFPEDIAAAARSLYEQFSSTGWGNPAAARQGEADGPYRSLTPITTFVQGLELPPKTHPIYGDLGIMYGASLVRENGSIRKRQRPDLKEQKCSVHGHNALLVGAWFPDRLLARIHGAHGESQAGISGSQVSGAYSIVLSKDYIGLDCDEGNIIHYSAPGSHVNTDPNAIAPSTQGAQRLHKSIETGKPVRVLRSSGAASIARPSCGIRYDGLYLVTGVEIAFNPSGGQYERFRLERQANQLALEAITTPTSRQVGDYDHIGNYYGSFRR